MFSGKFFFQQLTHWLRRLKNPRKCEKFTMTTPTDNELIAIRKRLTKVFLKRVKYKGTISTQLYGLGDGEGVNKRSFVIPRTRIRKKSKY